MSGKIDKLMKLYIAEFEKTKSSLHSMTSNYSKSNTGKGLRKSPSIENISSDNFGTLLQSGFKAEGSGTVVRVQFLDLMNELEPSFQRFKKTNSFVSLYTILKTFEDITEHASISW